MCVSREMMVDKNCEIRNMRRGISSGVRRKTIRLSKIILEIHRNTITIVIPKVTHILLNSNNS
jgi:hypothetical protein